VWAGRPGAIDGEGVKLLQESLRLGLQHRAEIARGWAENSHLSPDSCESYLQHNIRYQLGAEELSGATAFFERAFNAGLCPRKTALRFFDDGRPERPITTVRTAPPLPVPRTGTDHPQKSLDALLTDAAAGQRLGWGDALRLYDKASTIDLGMAADLRRQALHGDGTVTYIIDRNVNYTNVCVTRCKFCNFYRPPGRADGYTHSKEVLAKRLQETVDLGGVAESLTYDRLESTYVSEVPRWACRWRRSASRCIPDGRSGRNVGMGTGAADGPEMGRAERRTGLKNTGPSAGRVGALGGSRETRRNSNVDILASCKIRPL
jgi:hypothetical protein